MPKRSQATPVAELLRIADRVEPLIAALMERRREVLARLEDIDGKLRSLGAAPDDPAPAVIPPTQSILLSVEQVCLYLGGTSESKVWAMASAGEIPAPKKFGRVTRWHRGELDTWADRL